MNEVQRHRLETLTSQTRYSRKQMAELFHLLAMESRDMALDREDRGTSDYHATRACVWESAASIVENS